jgi:SAM-dependent methyltransferase
MAHGTYESQRSFWRRGSPLLGDLVARPAVLELLGDATNRCVLEAGCGTGYLARALAARSHTVYGCDLEPTLIAVAREAPVSAIRYAVADVTCLPYCNAAFDLVLSVSVLMHLDADGIRLFLHEARRVLRPTGRLGLSVPHPGLVDPDSPAMTGAPCWVRYTPTHNGPRGDAQFEERYYAANGDVFVSMVWAHSIALYHSLLDDAGFRVRIVREPKVEVQHLLVPEWGPSHGYRAYFQVLAEPSSG